MQRGRKGMGSHKHGVSGHVGNNQRDMIRTAHELNEEAERKRKVKAGRKTNQYKTVKELMEKET